MGSFHRNLLPDRDALRVDTLIVGSELSDGELVLTSDAKERVSFLDLID